jgi:hypothetical protein
MLGTQKRAGFKPALHFQFLFAPFARLTSFAFAQDSFAANSLRSEMREAPSLFLFNF